MAVVVAGHGELPEEVALFRIVPEPVSVLDDTKGSGHTDLVTC